MTDRVTPVRCNRLASIVATIAIVTGCGGPAPTERPGAPTGPALFYAKNGSLYVSAPLGASGRKLTDGPGDTQPAPSPDGKRLAYVHKSDSAEAGGELRVLDVASGDSRRLVDPAVLKPTFDGDRPQINSPSWSPAGDRIAFLKATEGGGGFLLTADPDTGAVQAPDKPLFADFGYSWSPDGRRIVWAGGRSDVSPVDVNVLTVGGGSEPIVKGTNATSVGYERDGRTVLFSNEDATGSLFEAIPFALRTGGVYTVAPPSAAKALLSGTLSFTDVQALPAGGVAASEWIGPDWKNKTVVILGPDGTKRAIAETPGDAPRPMWITGKGTGKPTVAYIGEGPGRPLLVIEGEAAPVTIDDGVSGDGKTAVDAFAWSSG